MAIAIFNILRALVKKLGQELGISIANGAKIGGTALKTEVGAAVEETKAKTKEVGQEVANPPR
jgi:hypothetical protein